MTPESLDLAREIWNYHLLNHELKQVDAILALGSNDIRVAEHAADLYLEGYAPRLILSGGVGELTRGMFKASEAEAFAEIAMKKGIPESAIIFEKNSTNTGENIQFTKEVLFELQLDLKSFIVVQKPFMERRAFATFKKRWPEKDLLLSSPRFSFDSYPNETLDLESIVHVMVGDLQRIRDYPAKGFQIEQNIPKNVEDAFDRLVELGYTQHLISE